MQWQSKNISFRISLTTIFLLAVLGVHGQKIPGFWYEDNNMKTAGGFPPDFTEMFTSPAKWEQLRDTLSVYMVRGNTLSNIISQEGESFIADYFAPVINGSNLSLAIDNPPPVNAWPDFYKLLTDNGITLTHVALQSVLSKPRDGVSPQFDPELENRIQEVKNDIQGYYQAAPDVKYGIIDARPTKGWEYMDAYKRCRDALRSTGLDLDFILLDCPYAYLLQGTNINWRSLKDVEAYVMDSLDVGFGLSITDNTGGMESDQAFHDRVLAYASNYDKTGSVPDFFVLMSWFLYPSVALPEDAPEGQYPMTKVGLELFRYLGGFYAPAGIALPGKESMVEARVRYQDGQLFIDYNRPIQSVRIYDIMGRQVNTRLERNIKSLATGFMYPGLYLVLVQSETGSFCQKVYIHGR